MSKKILIVDDEKSIVDILSFNLGREGYETLAAYVAEKGVKTGFVMWPIRTAVSGKQMTPAGATEIMEVLGKEESLERIRKGIALLEA